MFKRFKLSLRKAKETHDAWNLPQVNKLWNKWLFSVKINFRNIFNRK